MFHLFFIIILPKPKYSNLTQAIVLILDWNKYFLNIQSQYLFNLTV